MSCYQTIEEPYNKVDEVEVLVIGGGFYGAYLAEHFARKGRQVRLVEQSGDLMQGASLLNQARVHNGYHYPRSVLTGSKCRISYPRFVEEFKDCIENRFENYYLIGRSLSQITARQFQAFCQRIEARCEPSPDIYKTFVDPQFVEAAFATDECVFDSSRLKDIMKNRLLESGVEVDLNTQMTHIRPHAGALQADLNTQDQTRSVLAQHIFNCTYASLNQILKHSGIPQIPLKHQYVEICLVEVPTELKNKGFTVMCGPFFSLMPYPSTPYHTLSHVRYTPHLSWEEGPNSDHQEQRLSQQSAWHKMQKDASRYIPAISKCQYVDSLWTTKTILPSSETTDSRPILFKRDHGIKGLHCILGGKIDNIYDVIDYITVEGVGL